MRGAAIFLICATSFLLGDAKTLNNNICLQGLTVESLLPHERCNRFYQCVSGELISQRCPAHLQFNVETQKCDWPDNVVCGNRDDSESEEIDDKRPDDNNNVNDDPSLAPIICAAEGSDGVLVAHEYCNKFYICSGGVRVAMPCPAGLLYNPFKEECDWPGYVRCGNRIDPDTQGENDIADESDDINEGNYDPSEAPVICAAEGSDGVLVAHEYCNKFYKCSSGSRVVIECPATLLFNPRKNQCDWSENVNCAKRIIPDSDTNISGDEDRGNDNPSEAPVICASEGSDGVLVAHEHCNKFYKCSRGVPHAIPCQSYLLYNPRKEWCDWPENVNCEGRIIPGDDSGEQGSEDNENDDTNNSGNDNPNEAPEICGAENSDGVLVAHEHCNKFYKCSGGLPVAISCQANLLYDPRKEWCDWPQNVNCGDRIIA